MGVTIILVLVGALVGPFFIDWTLYRSTFETYAEQVLGHPVTVLGEADMRLLPAPSITFSDVRVGPSENPLLVVSRFQMQVELPPLLKGEVKVQDLRLDRPHLQLSLDEDGRLDWLTSMPDHGMLAKVNADDVAFESVTITNGAISIVDARSGDVFRFENGNLSLSARSLAGPFKIDGSISHERSPYSVELATGRLQEDGAIRVKGRVTPSQYPVDLSLDGLVSHEDAAPRFEGGFDVASIQAPDAVDNAWTMTGQLAADMTRFEVPEFEFHFGPQERQLSLTGKADLVYSGDRRFEVRATSKQVDLDRLLGGGPASPVNLKSTSEAVLTALANIPVPPIKGAISLDVPAVVAGGGLTQDVRLDLETMLGGWRIARLAARAPGRTVIATQGDLVVGSNMTYSGNVSLSSQQPGAFVGWWRHSGAGATTLQPIDMEGRLTVIPGGYALENLRLGLNGAKAEGSLSYRTRTNGSPVFAIHLNADQLDLNELILLGKAVQGEELGLRGVSERAGILSDLEVSARIQSDELLIGDVQGKNIGIEASYADGDVRIDRLFAGDLAGAEVDVKGGVNNITETPQGSLSGSLVASDLGGLVGLLKSVFPESGIVERVKAAAPYLVPARFKADFTAQANDDKSDVFIDLDGEAGEAMVTVSGQLSGRTDAGREADVGLELNLSGPDGGTLLRQLGFDVLPVDNLGEGHVRLTARGKPQTGLDIDLDAGSAAARVAATGTLRLEEGKSGAYELRVKAETADLAPVALLAGRVLPIMGGGIPVDLSFDVSGNGEKLSLSAIEGAVSGVTIEGSIAGNLVPLVSETSRRFTGDLTVSDLDLRVLSEAILGPDQWFSAGDGSSIWPSVAFGSPLLSDIDLTLQVKSDRLQVAEGLEIANASSELRLTPMMLRLDGINGQFASGALTGALAVRRSDAEGALSGRIKLQGADIRRLVWTRNARPVATGLMDLYLEFDGAGRSISAIVSGLNGGGTVSIHDGELRGLNPKAFDLVIRAADAGLELEDDRIKEAFLSHMEAGNLSFSKLEGNLSLLGGRISARNIVVDAADAEIFGSVEADLNTWMLDSDVSIRIDPGENAVTGAEPQVGLLFVGSLDEPERVVDIAPFSAFLTLRAFDLEVRRVERLQAEILERDRLLRELKRYREEDRRVEEAAAAEAARKAAEEAAGPTGEGTPANGAAVDGETTESTPPPVSPEQRQGNLSAPVVPPAAAPSDEASNQAGVEQPQAAENDTASLPETPAPTSADEFSSQIKSALEAARAREAAAAQAAAPAQTPEQAATTSELPPLSSPQTIDELLTLDLRTTPSAPSSSGTGSDADLFSPNGTRQAAPQRIRSTQPVSRATRSEPQFIQLPNGLVRENPNWSGN